MIVFVPAHLSWQEWGEQLAAMRALHPDMDPEKAYGGIEKLWVKPAWHPFNRFYQWHDQQYNLARIGLIKGPDSSGVDDTLKEMCQAEAGRIFAAEMHHAEAHEWWNRWGKKLHASVKYQWLMAEAELDHKACRLWGYWRWPDAARA